MEAEGACVGTGAEMGVLAGSGPGGVLGDGGDDCEDRGIGGVVLLVLSAVRGMAGISLGPWLGEVAVSGEAGVSITRADLGK